MQQWSVLQKRLIWCLECLFYKNLTRDNIPKEVIFKLVIVRNLLDKTHILTRTIMNDIFASCLANLALCLARAWPKSQTSVFIIMADKYGDNPYRCQGQVW